ncbi:MAG: MarR family transcriptional regulator, partial [Lysinibacillus fusiformis]|nr:MarR family transcriptional regulator [Lysinibacillus fusiformis]
MKEDNRNLKAFTVLFRAYQTIQEATKRDLLQFDLNQTEFSVLEFLYHRGEQPIQVIGKRILIASSSITYVIDKLEQKGYVYRKSCPRDRRV